ncbi:unnamed protein product [Schistosoma curassoni]|uniref:Transposase n=1 Tax=Schistosoma curassoni TaxID=6186 RepID=A0A183JTZ1_9TREM|nr:unnamed protein product [Schistosoma curassoni]
MELLAYGIWRQVKYPLNTKDIREQSLVWPSVIIP